MEPASKTEPVFIISASPFKHSGCSISASMRGVLIALVPALTAALYYFGTGALSVVAACCISAVCAEALCQKIMRRPVTITDGSALLTGLLLSFCLPPGLHPGIAAFGSACAIIIGKQIFGGLGANIFNPAHIGRAILLASFPAQMTSWQEPLGAIAAAAVSSATKAADAVTSATKAAADAAASATKAADAVASATKAAADAATSATTAVDGITNATPLALMRGAEHMWQAGAMPPDGYLPQLSALFWGNTAGSLGETCVPALIAGGLFLIWRQIIDWRIPFFYIATTGIICAIYGFFNGYPPFFALYHIMAGGLMIGAFFMATDWVTSPITKKGRIIFAVGLGIITALIRLRGGYIEGVCYSILIMNMLTPLIDKYIVNTPFGGGGRHA